jgi:hypothetical protein
MGGARRDDVLCGQSVESLVDALQRWSHVHYLVPHREEASAYMCVCVCVHVVNVCVCVCGGSLGTAGIADAQEGER